MKANRFLEKNYIWITLLLISIVFCMPLLLTKGLIKGDDLYFHLTRMAALASSSAYPSQIQSWWLQGWGYAIGAYYPDLFIVPFSFLLRLGVSLVTSYKLLVFILNMSTVFVTYYSFKKIIKNKNIALLGTIVYIFAPYRLTDFYSRAALGECFAFLFIPLIVLGLYQLYTTSTEALEYKYLWILPSLGFAGILSSHLLSAVIVGLFTIIIVLINIKKSLRKKTLLSLLTIMIASIVLSLWFLIPFFDFSSTNTVFVDKMGYDLAKNAASLLQLLNPIPFITTYTNLPIQIGLPLLMGMLLFILIIIIKKEKSMIVITSLTVTFISLWMSSGLFPYDWLKTIPLLNNIFQKVQFPWRYQIICVASLSICTMLAFKNLKKRMRSSLIVLFSVLCLVYLPMYHLYVSNNGIDNYERYSLDTGYVSFGEYLPFCYGNNVNYHDLMQDTELYSDEGISTSNNTRKDTSLSFDVINNNETYGNVYLPLNYYAQYKVRGEIPDNTISLYMNDDGRVTVSIPGNYSGLITVYYTQPFYYHIGYLVSLSSLVMIVWLLFKRKSINMQSKKI